MFKLTPQDLACFTEEYTKREPRTLKMEVKVKDSVTLVHLWEDYQDIGLLAKYLKKSSLVVHRDLKFFGII